MATDLTLNRGDRTFLDVAISGVTAEEVAAATFVFSAKLAIGDPDGRAVIRKTTIDGSITATEGQAAVAVLLVPADTGKLPWPAYRHLFYDVQMTPGDGTGPFTVLVGQLLITPDVSVA